MVTFCWGIGAVSVVRELDFMTVVWGPFIKIPQKPNGFMYFFDEI